MTNKDYINLDKVIRIGKLVSERLSKFKYKYQAIREVANIEKLQEITIDKYYLAYLCFEKGRQDAQKEIIDEWIEWLETMSDNYSMNRETIMLNLSGKIQELKQRKEMGE